MLDGVPLVVWEAHEAADGSFEPLEVQPEGRKRMTYAEYLRGLYAWGPAIPAEFLLPNDVAELATT